MKISQRLEVRSQKWKTRSEKITKDKLPSLKTKLILSLATLFFLNCGVLSAQYTIPKIPELQTSVYDYANVLSAEEKVQLEEKLIRYSDSTTTQIVVITVESLQGEDVSLLATKWGQTWGIGGSEKTDNGVVILVAKAERKIAINPGYGLEDRLTAGIGGEIIRNIIIPEFKAGSYYNGLDKGADAVFDVFKGKYKGERKQSKKEKFPIKLIFIIVFIILFIIIKSKNNGGNSGNSGNSGGGPSLLDVIILSSLGRNSGGGFGGSSGGGFGGSSGGGFGGGFGGGGFSGGGSSGGW